MLCHHTRAICVRQHEHLCELGNMCIDCRTVSWWKSLQAARISLGCASFEPFSTHLSASTSFEVGKVPASCSVCKCGMMGLVRCAPAGLAACEQHKGSEAFLPSGGPCCCHRAAHLARAAPGGQSDSGSEITRHAVKRRHKRLPLSTHCANFAGADRRNMISMSSSCVRSQQF